MRARERTCSGRVNRGPLPVTAALVVAAVCLAPRPADAREIVDMIGRKVTVPDRITKAVALSPPGTYLLHAVAPDVVAGLNFPLWEEERKYTVPKFRSLPVIGGRVGEGRLLNVEVLMKIAPDVAILWARSGALDAIDREYERTLGKVGVPVVCVQFDGLRGYPAALRFMGDLLGRSERAELLALYAVEAIGRVDRALGSLPPTSRRSVFYAEGMEGLATDGDGSMHTELIPLAGGRNVHRAPPKTMMGMEIVSLEQVFLYDPDVILVKERAAFARILSEPRWRDLRAVRDKKVFLIPHVPFNWFDRPPSFMRILGAQWLTQLLHPDRCAWDMVAETKRFYRLFLGVELTDAMAREVLLTQSAVNPRRTEPAGP